MCGMSAVEPDTAPSSFRLMSLMSISLVSTQRIVKRCTRRIDPLSLATMWKRFLSWRRRHGLQGQNGTMKHRAHLLAALGAAMIAGSCAGCAYLGIGHAPPCMPPAFSVSPASAHPGEAVTVAAPNAGCDPSYGEDAEVRVWMMDASGEQVVEAIAPMNDAGGCSYVFDVPLDAVPGAAAVSAVPHDVDWCDDTGRNNRLATGPDDVELVRASCVLPTRTLVVLD